MHKKDCKKETEPDLLTSENFLALPSLSAGANPSEFTTKVAL
jgi:hypothetical protein